MEMLQFPDRDDRDHRDRRHGGDRRDRTRDGLPEGGDVVDGRAGEPDIEMLQRRVGELWMIEPRGGPATRGRLLTELQRLEFEIERLSLLAIAGEYVPRSAATSCAARFYTLRRRWSGDDLAA